MHENSRGPARKSWTRDLNDLKVNKFVAVSIFISFLSVFNSKWADWYLKQSPDPEFCHLG